MTEDLGNVNKCRDIWSEILCYLPIKDLLNTSRTCRSVRSHLSASHIWIPLMKDVFGEYLPDGLSLKHMNNGLIFKQLTYIYGIDRSIPLRSLSFWVQYFNYLSPHALATSVVKHNRLVDYIPSHSKLLCCCDYLPCTCASSLFIGKPIPSYNILNLKANGVCVRIEIPETGFQHTALIISCEGNSPIKLSFPHTNERGLDWDEVTLINTWALRNGYMSSKSITLLLLPFFVGGNSGEDVLMLKYLVDFLHSIDRDYFDVSQLRYHYLRGQRHRHQLSEMQSKGVDRQTFFRALRSLLCGSWPY